MSLFRRRSGRHADLGSFNGWSGLARYAAAAAAHPVVDPAIARPANQVRVTAPGWPTQNGETR
jgi:hypothetical protein